MSVEKLQQIDCLAGVQDIAIRQDNKFFVTGGWDKRYVKTFLKESLIYFSMKMSHLLVQEFQTTCDSQVP